MGMQPTSVHARTTSYCKKGWENRTWWSPSPSSGLWKERSFFQDHLWVIWTMEAGITTFLWFGDSSFVYHESLSSNCPLHEHDLSFLRSRCCSSAGALSFTLVVGHSLISQKELCMSQELIASSISMTCSLLVHHMFPSSNCHVHAQVVSSPRSQLMPSRHVLSGRIAVLASVLAGLGAQGHLNCWFLNES